jgi:hypothetical protein
MRLIVISLAAVAALGACSQPSPPATPEEPASAPTPSAAASTPPAAQPPVNEPAAPAPSDACGAAERQSWIGRPRGELPAAPAGANWRVYETGQPVTQDFRPDRLNIEIDPAKQTVVRVSCG